MNTTNEEREFAVDSYIALRLQTSIDISTRIAVVESNYASKEYVSDVRWQVVKWFVGVALGGLAAGAGLAALMFVFFSP